MQVSGMKKSIVQRVLRCIGVGACLLLVANAAFAVTPLPTDKAFQFSVTINGTQQVETHWKIAPGYYLYKNKFHFEVTPTTKISLQFPKSEFKHDEKHGRYEVYSGNISIPLFLQTNVQSVQLQVDYQGCSDGGFCYPPVHKVMILNLSQRVVIDQQPSMSMQSLLTNQHGITLFLKASSMSLVLLMFVGLGLLLAFTPCILPVVPILTSVIIGHKEPVSTKKALFLTSAYIFGMSLAYALAGLLVASMGHSLQVWLQNVWVISVVCILFVLLALSLFGVYYLRLPRQLHNAIAHLNHKQQSGTYAGAFAMGILSTLIVSPCVTAPLVGVLLYIAETGNQLFGASALFALGVGMGLPLLLVGMSAGKYLPKSGPWMEAIKKSFGFVMLGMAIWLLSRVVSATAISLLWAVLLLGVAFFMAGYLPLLFKRHIILRGLGGVVGVLGVFVMLSVLPIWHGNAPVSANNGLMTVASIADANERIAVANTSHLPVIIDFYADWCESCVSMDHKVFSQPNVKKALAGFVVLRVDLSANNRNDQALLNYFNVIAPPTMLFFSSDGREVNARRIIGEVSATEFLSRISLFYAEGCDKKAQC